MPPKKRPAKIDGGNPRVGGLGLRLEGTPATAFRNQVRSDSSQNGPAVKEGINRGPFATLPQIIGSEVRAHGRLVEQVDAQAIVQIVANMCFGVE
jgi:hypothetical protein